MRHGNVRGRAHIKNGETKLMTNLRTLSIIAVLSAGIAGPAFAQDADVQKPIQYGRSYDQRNFGAAYNRLNGPHYGAPFTQAGRNMENFGFSGRDRSWVGGEDPALNPAGD